MRVCTVRLGLGCFTRYESATAALVRRPGVDGSRREILTWDQFGDAAPSLAVAAGDDAA